MTGRIRILSTWRGGATDFDRVLSRGNTSDVYAIGVDAVVKVPRPDVPDHWIEIEARHAAAVHEAGLPSPMVLDLTSVNGRPAIVFERVEGPSMLEELAASPRSADGFARDMAALQRRLHAAQAPGPLPELRDRVAGKIGTASGVSAHDRVEALEVLDGLPAGSSVCHGDLHPGNILLGRHGPMVIDWFDATAGVPVADIVRTSLITGPVRSDSSPPPHLPGLGLAVLNRFHRTYVGCMLGDLDADRVAALSWEAVLAVSRLAEPVGRQADDLISIWRSRADLSLAPVTPLAELVLSSVRSEE